MARALLPLFAFGFFCLFLPDARAAFEYPHASARAAAMGRAFLAVKTEPDAVFSNPSGLADTRETRVSFLYAKPFAGLNDVNVNAGHAAVLLPTRLGQLGVGLARLEVAGLLSEQTVALGWGHRLPGGVRTGVAARHLTLAYRAGSDPLAAGDPVFRRGTSNTAMALDVGAAAPLGPFLEFGLAVRNINRPDIGLATEDRLPRDVDASLALSLAGMGLRAVGALNVRENNGGAAKRAPAPRLGLEKSVGSMSPLFLRAGAGADEYTAGFGLRFNILTANYFKVLTVDYGFVLNRHLARDSAGSHQLGVGYRWSRRPW